MWRLSNGNFHLLLCIWHWEFLNVKHNWSFQFVDLLISKLLVFGYLFQGVLWRTAICYGEWSQGMWGTRCRSFEPWTSCTFNVSLVEHGWLILQVIVSGKLRAQRAKSMKFKDGYMISSGQPVKEYIDSAVRHVLLRQVSLVFFLCYTGFNSVLRSCYFAAVFVVM